VWEYFSFPHPASPPRHLHIYSLVLSPPPLSPLLLFSSPQVFMGIAIINTFVPAPAIQPVTDVLYRWVYAAYVALIFLVVLLLEYQLFQRHKSHETRPATPTYHVRAGGVLKMVRK
jgi:hypothetical protein